MNKIDILVAALFNQEVDNMASINAVRFFLRKPLLEKGGRIGGATGEKLTTDRTASKYINLNQKENTSCE